MVWAAAWSRYQSETSVCGPYPLPPGAGDGEEEGTLAGDRRCPSLDAQFLTTFADHRGPRILARLDMSGRQPQTRLAVNDEQQLPMRLLQDDEVALSRWLTGLR
ncbi:hypothetical protein AMK33_38730 [Streptomyces sp. CB02400]|nr:hypothetical protein AMK33_38730 [Streptomyces sp. CB02400]